MVGNQPLSRGLQAVKNPGIYKNPLSFFHRDLTAVDLKQNQPLFDNRNLEFRMPVKGGCMTGKQRHVVFIVPEGGPAPSYGGSVPGGNRPG